MSEKMVVALKIDVTNIDKKRLFKGAKGTYLDCTVMIDSEEDQYGNCGMITQSVTKEERQSKNYGPILGNGKIIWRGESEQNGGGNQAPVKQNSAPQSQQFEDLDEDIPF